MARAYSQDLRDRVIDAVQNGQSRREAARHFGIGLSSAIKWMQHFERSGSRVDRGTGGHRPSHVRKHRDWLLRLAADEHSLTLAAMCERLRAEHDVRADPGMLSRFFRAEGITIKKNRAAQRAEAGRHRA